jgi:hypothetical protein
MVGRTKNRECLWIGPFRVLAGFAPLKILANLVTHLDFLVQNNCHELFHVDVMLFDVNFASTLRNEYRKRGVAIQLCPITRLPPRPPLPPLPRPLPRPAPHLGAYSASNTFIVGALLIASY